MSNEDTFSNITINIILHDILIPFMWVCILGHFSLMTIVCNDKHMVISVAYSIYKVGIFSRVYSAISRAQNAKKTTFKHNTRHDLSVLLLFNSILYRQVDEFLLTNPCQVRGYMCRTQLL